MPGIICTDLPRIVNYYLGCFNFVSVSQPLSIDIFLLITYSSLIQCFSFSLLARVLAVMKPCLHGVETMLISQVLVNANYELVPLNLETITVLIVLF